MDKFEQLMERASDEVRQSARGATPPMTEPVPRARRPGWLAFAAGFAVVILAIGFLPSLIGGQNPPAGSPDPTGPPVTSAPESPTTTGTQPQVECSSTGVPVPGPVEGLPPAVAAMRTAIIAAAAACDFDALEALGAGTLQTQFDGGGEADALRRWEGEGRGELDSLLKILGMSFSRYEYENPEPATFFTWPAAFGYDSWEDIPQEYVDELLTLYTQDELDYIAQFGGYAGWRTGITEDGKWTFFVAGD